MIHIIIIIVLGFILFRLGSLCNNERKGSMKEVPSQLPSRFLPHSHLRPARFFQRSIQDEKTWRKHTFERIRMYRFSLSPMSMILWLLRKLQCSVIDVTISTVRFISSNGVANRR